MSVTHVSRRAQVLRRGAEQPEQHRLPFEIASPAVPAAAALLVQARQGLVEAGRESRAAPRFIASYLSALRAAAAILAARGRPHRGRSRPESVWTLLQSAMPELAQWASFFAAHSARQAAAQAGVTRRITAEGADELHRRAGEFVALAGQVVHGRQTGSGPGTRCGAVPRARKPRGG